MIEDDVYSTASATDELAEYSSGAKELCTSDTKYHAMRCANVSDAVSIAEFKAKCSRHLEVARSEDGVARKVAEIPPGPVRDFGLTEMLGISIAELVTVREQCK